MVDARVLVADSFPIVVRGIASLFGEDAVGVVTRKAGGNPLGEIRRVRPDIVIQELHLAGSITGPDLCSQVKELPWPVRVLFYTANTDADGVVAALSAGADSYLHKSVEVDVLVEAVRRTVAGERVWRVEAEADSSRSARVGQLAGTNLTRRERQVLALVLSRYRNDEIARELDLATQTVKNAVCVILRKLQVRDRRQLFAAPHQP